MPSERKCENCRSQYKVSKDQRSGRLLCKRCLYWQNFQGLVNQGDESSAIIRKQLDSCYPNNVEKQKDLFIAIMEILDEADRAYAISDDALIRIAMKWQVERVVCEEMVKAIADRNSILIKKTEDKSTISHKKALQTD